jgi:hypothetical protein
MCHLNLISARLPLQQQEHIARNFALLKDVFMYSGNAKHALQISQGDTMEQGLDVEEDLLALVHPAHVVVHVRMD